MESTEMQKSISLYEISEEIELLSTKLVEMNGELTPELEEMSNQVMHLLLKKTDNMVGYSRQLSDSIEMVEKRRKELQALEKTLTNRLDRFKDYVKYCMHKMGEKKIESVFSRMTVTKGRHSVVITDESKITDKKYFTDVRTYKKKEIEADIKAGINVEGAYLRAGDEGLRMEFK